MSSNHKNRSHSIMGGSRASIYMKCTGYFSIIQDLPPQESNKDADQGTLFHEMMEIVVDDFLQYKLTGTDPDIRFHLLAGSIDSEMKENIEECKNLVWEKGLDKFITGKAYGIEDYFSLGKIGDIDIGGPVDFWAIYRDKKGARAGLIVDYKYGYTYVDENTTHQLPHYATCMEESFDWKLDYIRTAVLQPRAGGETWREVKFTKQELEKRKKKIFQIAEDVFIHGKIKYHPGDHCTWCPGRGSCAARQEYLSNKSKLLLVRDVRLPNVRDLTDDQRARLLIYKDDIIDFLKAVYSDSIQQHKAGKTIPGFKVVKGTSKRKWRKETEEIVYKLNELGIKEPVVVKQELKTITEIEKELKKLVGSSDEAKTLLQSCTEYGTVPEILVPESDPRPSVKAYRDLLDENNN